MSTFIEAIATRLKREIEVSGIPARVIDYLAISRDGHYGRVSENLNYLLTSPKEYTRYYPLGIAGISDFAPNCFSLGISGVFAELSPDGSFRSYWPLFGPMDTSGYQPLDELVPITIPEQADTFQLERQALIFLNYLRRNDFKLKKGTSPEALPPISIVRTHDPLELFITHSSNQ